MRQDDSERRRLAQALGQMTGQSGERALQKAPEKPASAAAPSSKESPRRARPAFPTLSSAAADSADNAESPQVVDDDRVPIPAITPEYLLSRKRSSIGRSAAPAVYQSLFARRTIVPILLTLGVLLPVLGTLWFFTNEDSPFRALSIAVPISLIAGGTLLLVLGVLNVLHLAYLLRSKEPVRRRDSSA